MGSITFRILFSSLLYLIHLSFFLGCLEYHYQHFVDKVLQDYEDKVPNLFDLVGQRP